MAVILAWTEFPVPFGAPFLWKYYTPQVCLELDTASTKNCFWWVPWLFKPSLPCLWACARGKRCRLWLHIRQFSALLAKVALPRVWSYQTNVLLVAGAVVLQAVRKPVNTSYLKFRGDSLGSTEACMGILWHSKGLGFLLPRGIDTQLSLGKKNLPFPSFRIKERSCEWMWMIFAGFM